jgi:hypothetical protein
LKKMTQWSNCPISETSNPPTKVGSAGTCDL